MDNGPKTIFRLKMIEFAEVQHGDAGGTATMSSSKDGGIIGHGGNGGRPKSGYFFDGRGKF